MNSEIKIELYEEHDAVSFYTLRFKGEDTEIDKFFDCFPEGCEYENDIDIIIKWLDQIGERGAQERYFRPEGKIYDNIWAIPLEKSKLRLYIIRISEDMVVLGNGGVKTTKTYNKDSHLNGCVELLQQIDVFLKQRLKTGSVQIYNNQLFGNLKFHLKSD